MKPCRGCGLNINRGQPFLIVWDNKSHNYWHASCHKEEQERKAPALITMDESSTLSNEDFEKVEKILRSKKKRTREVVALEGSEPLQP